MDKLFNLKLLDEYKELNKNILNKTLITSEL